MRRIKYPRINPIDASIILICSIFIVWVYLKRNTVMVVHDPNAFHHPAMFEISGIEQDLQNPRYLWSHNDSGDEGRLFFTRIPSFKKLDGMKDFYELIVKNKSTQEQVLNVDWEDIALSDQGILYIGDIGNNFNWRKDLGIYRIDLKQAFKDPHLLENLELFADHIPFVYENQKEFPPLDWDKRKYDAEALFVKDDQLFLINKSFMGGTENQIWIYAFPKDQEMVDWYERSLIEKMDQIQDPTQITQTKQITQNPLRLKVAHTLTLSPPNLDKKSLFSPLSLRVTAADYWYPYLAILCYEHLFIFKWEGHQLSPYPSNYLKLEPREYQQIEALTWIKDLNGDVKLLIANEQRKLFEIRLDKLKSDLPRMMELPKQKINGNNRLDGQID